MPRCFYTAVMYALQPFILLFMLIRSIKSPNYRKRLKERYGFYSNITPPKPNGIIIHAASVGEVIAATLLVKKIRENYPHLPITMTTVTPTGSDRVKAAWGENVTHVYLPYDLPGAIERFIRFVRPKACIVIETEIWPNLIRHLYQHHVPFIVANARLSARSAKRYQLIKTRFEHILADIALIAPQDEISGKRYLDLGYDKTRLKLTGNIKYDLKLNDELLQQVATLKQAWGKQRPIWVAASTHEGEEEIILKTHRTLLETHPDLLLILVPRHPERFHAVAELIKKAQFNFVYRSRGETPDETTQVVLGDTMGELMLFYGIADIAFVGGSLVKHGGHNPLEPLVFKVPVVSGKYTFNFPEVFAKLLEVQGAVKVNETPQALARSIDILLGSPQLRQRLGEAGYEVLIENQGALDRLLDLLRPYLEKTP